jgi:hypothetical protein
MGSGKHLGEINTRMLLPGEGHGQANASHTLPTGRGAMVPAQKVLLLGCSAHTQNDFGQASHAEARHGETESLVARSYHRVIAACLDSARQHTRQRQAGK